MISDFGSAISIYRFGIQSIQPDVCRSLTDAFYDINPFFMQEANKFYSSQAGDEGFRVAEQRISFFLSDPNEVALDLSGLNLRRIPKSIVQSPISKRLTELNLTGNGIDDVKLLSELVNLEVLRLHDNILSNLQPLERLQNLVYLDLSENQIRTVTKCRD